MRLTIDPMKKVRRFLVQLIEPTEDDLDETTKVEPPDPTKRVTVQDLANNHVYHLALAVNGLHIRVGRLEAKVGLILALAFGIFGLAAKPVVEPIVNAMVNGVF